MLDNNTKDVQIHKAGRVVSNTEDVQIHKAGRVVSNSEDVQIDDVETSSMKAGKKVCSKLESRIKVLY